MTKIELLYRKMDLLLQTGVLLMESAADTTRILRNMRRTAAFLGLAEENLHLYVNYDILQANYSDPEHSFTKFKRCQRHGIDMTAIGRVSRLSWKAIKRDYSLERYEEELNNIRRAKRNYTPWQVAIAGGFACGGFCIQFGCDWTAFFYASLAAILGFRLRMWLGEKGSNAYVAIGMGALVSSIIAWLTTFLSLSERDTILSLTDNNLLQPLMSAILNVLHSETPYHPLMACALFIVPGVPLINFVSDMLDGHIQIGITRAVNTLMMVMAMAFGIALAIKICGIDNFVHDLSMTPHHSYIEYAIAAGISAMGFSTIFNLPRRLLPVVCAGGIIAVCNRNFVNLGPSSGNVGLDLGLTIGSLVGSSMVSVICVWAQHWFHTPHHTLSIPSVIPMVPGVLMYRALFAFIDMHGVVGEVTIGMNNAIMASLVILCIALGVAIPNIFVHRMLETKRKQKLYRLLVERRKKRGEFVKLEEL